jgi:ABC-type lipoprotein release transport system permease subunit
MYRSLFNRPDGYGPRRRRRRPRSRAAGCLLWIVLLIVILIVLSVLFGGFQKGTKTNGLGPMAATSIIVDHYTRNSTS